MAISNGACIEMKLPTGLTFLHEAISWKRPNMVRILLDSGADPTVPTPTGRSPVNLACSLMAPTAILTDLLAHMNSTCVNQPDSGGRTPLHEAAITGHVDGVKVLLGQNASISVRDNDGCTPLHLAAFRGNDEIIRLLCQAGIDPNARDSHGQTPLHYAVEWQQSAAARALVRLGADPNLADESGKSPITIAKEAGNRSTIASLTSDSAYFRTGPIEPSR